ncbi:MAG: hypothetical protein KKD38_08680, partial [Candidatus Delongbacteria bacterium]|nr:hypothetical protein [Candidatus Delongbacteria bacterium]
MKRMMIIFMVVIGFCFVLVAQDNGMDEFWKKHPELLKEYYTDVYLPKLKMSKDNVSTFKDEYFNKVENIVIEDYKKQNRQNEISKDFNYNNFISKYLIEEKMVKYRFNLLKFNELKEMGINYFDIVFNGVNYRDLYNKTTIADYYFNNCIIFSGTIIDSTYIFKLDTVSIFGVDKEIKEHYANYRIRIDEIIKGDYLIDNLPENISLFNNYGAKTYVRDDRPYRMFDKTILIE